MEYHIRLATAEDMGAVLGLIQELADYEHESEAVAITEADLIHDGFGTEKRFHCFVAENTDGLVGIALVYPRYSTWKGPALHLEDLIVTQNMRGKGIGKALLTTVIKYGAELGVKRINWEVLDWNEPAIAFYEAHGAKVMRDWDVVQLNEAGIQNYLAKQ